jgi:hypothetical protein
VTSNAYTYTPRVHAKIEINEQIKKAPRVRVQFKDMEDDYALYASRKAQAARIEAKKLAREAEAEAAKAEAKVNAEEDDPTDSDGGDDEGDNLDDGEAGGGGEDDEMLGPEAAGWQAEE